MGPGDLTHRSVRHDLRIETMGDRRPAAEPFLIILRSAASRGHGSAWTDGKFAHHGIVEVVSSAEVG
jgi:hypothetical protein